MKIMEEPETAMSLKQDKEISYTEKPDIYNLGKLETYKIIYTGSGGSTWELVGNGPYQHQQSGYVWRERKE